MSGRWRAVFLDRDGTLVRPRHYPSRPDELQIYPGIPAELRLLQNAGFRLVLITNQSGIARGLFSPEDLDRMHASLGKRLADEGVTLAGIYFCPHHPDGVVPGLARHCGCRKPEPGMLLQAASDLSLDLDISWLIGDILDDVEAGNRVGCRTVLVDLGTESKSMVNDRRPEFVARDTLHGLRLIRFCEGLGPQTELQYQPSRWSQREVPVGAAGG